MTWIFEMNFYLWFTMHNKVPVFHFLNLSSLIEFDSLFGFNRIYNCKSIHYENLRFETIAKVDAVRRFTSYWQF